MKVTGEKFEISASEMIWWKEVKTIRILNNKLAFVLSNNQVIELTDLHPRVIDSAFRAYEKYVRTHPKKKSS